MAALNSMLNRPSKYQPPMGSARACAGFCALLLAIAVGGLVTAVAHTDGDKQPTTLAGQSPTATGQEVTLDLFAADGKGNPIADLTADQLGLEENGAAQRITDLKKASSEP